MIQSNRCRFGWHKWRGHSGITSGLKKCKRCELVVRYMPEMVPPPMPPLLVPEIGPISIKWLHG